MVGIEVPCKFKPSYGRQLISNVIPLNNIMKSHETNFLKKITFTDYVLIGVFGASLARFFTTEYDLGTFYFSLASALLLLVRILNRKHRSRIKNKNV